MRRRQKVNYPVYKVDRGLNAVMHEGQAEPKLEKAHISALKKLSRLTWRLVRIRGVKNDAASQETKLKRDIEKLLDELEPMGVIGLVRQAGTQTSTELKRVEVTGREVADALAMLDYLGDHSGEVVKSVQLPFAFMAQDREKFNNALSFLTGLYGLELKQKISLDINVSRLDALQKSGELGDEPEGLWQYKPQGHRIDAKILTSE